MSELFALYTAGYHFYESSAYGDSPLADWEEVVELFEECDTEWSSVEPEVDHEAHEVFLYVSEEE